MKSKSGLFFVACALLLVSGLLFRPSTDPDDAGPAPDPGPAPAPMEIPNPELLRPVLLHDQAEVLEYLEAFPADSYQVAEVEGLGRFYVDRFLNPGPVKSALLRNEPYEESTITLMASFLRPGQVALDVGAHIGALTVPMAAMVGGGGLVYAVEPQKKIFRELVHNLQLNGITNVVPLRYAAGDTTGIVEMNPAPEGNEGAASVGSGGDRVELRPLDSFSLPPLSFVKIDVEGFEDQVLDGAQETLRRSGYPPMIVEIQGGHDYVYADSATRARIDGTLRRLDDMDYHVLRIGSFMYLAQAPTVYEIGTAIDFRREGNADWYQTGFWSEAEAEGRWFFEDCPAGVVLRLDPYPVSEDMELFLDGIISGSVDTFVRDFTVTVDGQRIAEWRLRPSDERQRMHPSLVIPKELADDGLLRIQIRTRDRGGAEGSPESRVGVRQMALLLRSQVQ